MMSAGFCLDDKNDDATKLIATFSTKNWAYLFNEKALNEARISDQGGLSNKGGAVEHGGIRLGSLPRIIRGRGGSSEKMMF